MYYSEGLDLTVLVLLAEYKLKREILKNNFKYKDVEKKKKKEVCRKKPWEDTISKYSAFQKIFLFVINKNLEAGFQFVAWIVLNTTFLEHNYMSDTS